MNNKTLILNQAEIQAHIHALELARGIIGDREKEISELTAKLSNSIDMVGHEKAVGGLIALIERSREIVNEQAEDDACWFLNVTAPEAYLQQELRRLHKVIEETPSQSLATIKADAIEEMVKSFNLHGLLNKIRIQMIGVGSVLDYAAQLRKEGE